MSIESMVTVLNTANLTPRRKLILLGIANHDGDGGAWPSVSTLARYAGCSTRTVQRELQALTEAGFVTIEPQAGGSRSTRADRRPNLYRLHLPHVVDNSTHGVTPTVTPSESRGDIALSQRGDTAMSPETSLTVPYTNKRDSYVRGERECVVSDCPNIALEGKFRCVAHTRAGSKGSSGLRVVDNESVSA